MNENKKCEICGSSFNYISGWFTTHLYKEHNITLKEYVIKYELNGIRPKCKCGYCDEDAPFIRGKFNDYIFEHKKYTWIKEQYIKVNGIPICISCGSEVKWKRGIPNKYCSFKCLPNNWNQDKVKKTVMEKYNIDVVSKLDSVKEKLSKKQIENYNNKKEDIVNKFKMTCVERYGVEHPMYSELIINKQKDTIMKKYGVGHQLQILKNRINSSIRMTENNSTYTFDNKYRIRKYKNSDIYFQSTYEEHFLQHCEKLGIIDKINNGNIYTYIVCDNKHRRIITDFSIGNLEIEIKSTYILEKQGGIDKLNKKKDLVEMKGNKYILILDKKYDEFDEIIKNII